jgi:hypothetical protein
MKKKQSKADFLREWKLPYPSFKWDHLRYKNPPEKGVYWWHFSRFIRQRDVEQYGTCISCSRAITVDTCDAGHFMPAANCGRDLLFDERNVNAECYSCNAFDETHLLGYAEGLDKRYGEGAAARLRQRRQEYKDGPPIKDWKAKEYEEKIKQLPSYES